MAYSHDLLISQETGEFDWTYIKRQSVIFAQRNYGDVAPPVSYVRNELRRLKDLAAIMRIRWRKDHGLPDDTQYTTITAYGRQTEGFRRSAF